jgi:uncharacterized protein (TIGR03435 family)
MHELDDNALLRQCAEQNSETAFATLVARHVDKVYSVALRHTRNTHASEEITQAVFVILARKARALRQHAVLSGWLYETARLTALTYIRSEIRRARREQEAHMQTVLNENESEAWPHIVPLLDDALAKLSAADRHAIVLRYFDGKSLGEVGAALGASEDAAKKRVTRAVEKLRGWFTKRGVTLTATALTAAISANSVQAAPPSLAAVVVTAAGAKDAMASGSTLSLIKGALKVMAWTKAKTAIVVGVGVLLAAGIATVVVKQVQVMQSYPWQHVRANSPEGVRALNVLPPQVTIVRSISPPTNSDSLIDDTLLKGQWRYIGIHSTLKEVIQRAYEDQPLLPAEIIWPAKMPGGYYDYFANLTNGSQQALQQLIKAKFGLVGKYEMRETNVLVLQVNRPGARGLRVGTPPQPGQEQRGTLISKSVAQYKNRTMSVLAGVIAGRVNIPVIDKTGLTGNYDFDIPDKLQITPAEQLDLLKRILSDELGLELVPGREPVEMLVVEKVK